MELGGRVAAAIDAAGPGAPVRFVAGDLDDLAATRAQALALDREVVGFYGLVNNAAVVPRKPIADYALAEYESIQRVNAPVAFVLAQALAPSMQARRRRLRQRLLDHAWGASGRISSPASPPRARCSA